LHWRINECMSRRWREAIQALMTDSWKYLFQPGGPSNNSTRTSILLKIAGGPN
jgi:hypothetical protein